MPFFQPSSSERRGIIVLCLILLLIVGVVWLLPGDRRRDSQVTDTTRFAFGHKAPKFYNQGTHPSETFPFDPNTADSTTLLRLGLSPSMVRGIYKYRSLGYTYSEPADFSRVPGMTNELWERLRPCIRIDHRFHRVRPELRSWGYTSQQAMEQAIDTSRPLRDTVRFPVKLQPGATIELNSCDTSALKRVPGIGSYWARRITYYRQQLGGYASVGQLQDIEGMPEGLECWFTVNTVALRKIDVNHASKSQLVRHPYLRVYRAQAIWEYRHKYGDLKSLDDLRRLPDFSDDDIQRLAPYLEFK